MRKIEKNFDIPTYPKLDKLIDLDKAVLFDIETTSLSAKTGHIYIIAVLYKISETGYKFIQWFAESLLDEQKLLVEFKDFIKDFDCLIHFNGRSFDIPFINNAALAYGMKPFLTDFKNIDIYRKSYPLQQLLKLKSKKQRHIEQLFGLNRQDLYNGGELINVYNKYISDGNDEKLSLLLLHNEDDLLGLLHILSLMSYYKLFEANITYESYQMTDADVTFACRIHFPIPADITLELQELKLYTENGMLYIQIETYNGEAKYFFKNYKDYYYLPLEDMVIHSSIAYFVNESSKKKAKRRTAYTRLNSTFIPVYHSSKLKVFRKEFADKQNYIELTDKELNDPELLQEYCEEVLHFLHKKLKLKYDE